MAKTQKITMAGRPYTFVEQPEPEMAGHDNGTIGHLRNSRNEFAGYVTIMHSGARLLLGGPSGISRSAEREGLAQIIVTEPPKMLETVEDIEREAKAGSVLAIHAPDRMWRLKINKVDDPLPGGRAVGAWVTVLDDEHESYVYLKPGSTSIVRS